MTPTQKRQTYRRLLESDKAVCPASVFDPISARIAQEIGFELGMFAGSVASLAILGAPDITLITLSEFAEQALRITRSADLPVMVDADHGYGNALNVMRTVQELEIAGIAGLSIEDTALPQVYRSSGKAQLLSIEEGLGKMKAAVKARGDTSLVIAGRTSAAAISDVADTIARVKIYQTSGVDCLFLVGLKTREQLDAIASEARLPIFLGGVTAELRDANYLASRGVRVYLQGHQAYAASLQATYLAMKALREGVEPDKLADLPSAALMSTVTRDADYARWGKDYLE